MTEQYQTQLNDLSKELVTEERYGKLALAPVVQLRLLPETARIYDFPDVPETGL